MKKVYTTQERIKRVAAAKDLIYLATPYTHNDRAVQCERFEKITLISAMLVKDGVINFSPITHSHQQHDRLKLPGTWDFWEVVDTVFLKRSNELWVLADPGWKESVGVRAEIRIAENSNIPVYYYVLNDKRSSIEFISEQEAEERHG